LGLLRVRGPFDQAGQAILLATGTGAPLHVNELLTHNACCDRHRLLPRPLLNQAWMLGLLTDHKGCLNLLASLHDRVRAVEPVSQPDLTGLSIGQ
jgi:hypothetical protein